MTLKKLLFLSVLCLLNLSAATAQNQPYKTSVFHVGFFPPLDTHGTEARLYVNTVSFNILVGLSAGERAFAFASLGNTALGESSGATIAGLWNYAGGAGKGMALAGLVNIWRGPYAGVQLAGLANHALEIKGVQFSGLFNTVSAGRGFQGAGLFNRAVEAKGFQGAGVFNTAGRIKGFQGAGILNATGGIKGVQASGIINIAGDAHGAQLAGIINIAGRVRGVQLSALVNIAKSSPVPIGLINIIRDGEMSVAAVYRETGSLTAEFRSGSRITYGIIGIGYNLKAASEEAITTVAGIGARIPCTRWLRIGNELTVESIGTFSEHTTFKAGYALLPEFFVTRWLGIFGGPSINFMYADKSNSALLPSSRLWRGNVHSGIGQIHIGYTAGIECRF